METAPQSPKKGMHPGAAIFGMVVTFFIGVFIGLHPLWIPFDVGANNMNNTPSSAGPSSHPSEDRPATSTAPASLPA